MAKHQESNNHAGAVVAIEERGQESGDDRPDHGHEQTVRPWIPRPGCTLDTCEGEDNCENIENFCGYNSSKTPSGTFGATGLAASPTAKCPKGPIDSPHELSRKGPGGSQGPLRPFLAALFGLSRRAAVFGAGRAAALRVLGIASHRIIPAAWLAVFRFAAGLTVPGTTAGLSIVGRGGRCMGSSCAAKGKVQVDGQVKLLPAPQLLPESIGLDTPKWVR